MSMRVSEAGLVDLGLVLDVPSTVGVLESVQRLLEIAISNGHASNHESSAVATQGVLQLQGLGLGFVFDKTYISLLTICKVYTCTKVMCRVCVVYPQQWSGQNAMRVRLLPPKNLSHVQGMWLVYRVSAGRCQQ